MYWLVACLPLCIQGVRCHRKMEGNCLRIKKWPSKQRKDEKMMTAKGQGRAKGIPTATMVNAPYESRPGWDATAFKRSQLISEGGQKEWLTASAVAVSRTRTPPHIKDDPLSHGHPCWLARWPWPAAWRASATCEMKRHPSKEFLRKGEGGSSNCFLFSSVQPARKTKRAWRPAAPIAAVAARSPFLSGRIS